MRLYSFLFKTTIAFFFCVDASPARVRSTSARPLTPEYEPQRFLQDGAEADEEEREGGGVEKVEESVEHIVSDLEWQRVEEVEPAVNALKQQRQEVMESAENAGKRQRLKEVEPANDAFYDSGLHSLEESLDMELSLLEDAFNFLKPRTDNKRLRNSNFKNWLQHVKRTTTTKDDLYKKVAKALAELYESERGLMKMLDDVIEDANIDAKIKNVASKLQKEQIKSWVNEGKVAPGLFDDLFRGLEDEKFGIWFKSELRLRSKASRFQRESEDVTRFLSVGYLY